MTKAREGGEHRPVDWARGWLGLACLVGCASGPVVPHATPRSIPGEPLTFAICGDMRSDQGPEPGAPPSPQGQLFAELVRRRPAFVLNTGDLVTRGDRAEDWRIFDAWTAGLRSARIPYLPLLGNHEYYGKNDVALAEYWARFPELERAKWYSLRAGPLFVLFLDSNLNELSDEERGTQRLYATKAVQSAEQDPEVAFIAVAFHHPPYTNGPHPPAVDAQQELLRPLQFARKLKLVITGHVHSYERFVQAGLTYLVSGGCGAPPYPVEIDPSRRRFAPAYDGPAERGYHFVECTVDRGALRCAAQVLEATGFVELDPFAIESSTAPGAAEAYDD
ncbi:MAG: metallophosphoesterase [Deltaproteobacteria bacterium]|nr:metallophosphoesterase [Deltaproteobacteria bacterium]